MHAYYLYIWQDEVNGMPLCKLAFFQNEVYKMRPEETIDFQIKRAWQLISRLYNEVAARYDSTWASGNVLLNIDDENGVPSTSLGPKMGLEATSLSRILKNLEAKNLITRNVSSQDKRIVLVKLTEEGLQRRDEAKKAVKAFNMALTKHFEPQKMDVFFEFLTEMNRKISEGEISADQLS